MKKILYALAFLAATFVMAFIWVVIGAVYQHIKADHQSAHLAVYILNYNMERGKLEVPPDLLPKKEAAPQAAPPPPAPPKK